MADVKWIKIYTDMLNNKKIKRIRKMPEGNNIILIWVFLLTTAGESNKNGGLFLTDTIPFNEEDLSIEFDFDVSVIKFALITLEKFQMVEIFDSIIYIKNWSEYQNVEGLDKMREQTRLRVAKHRELKQLEQPVTPCNVTVTEEVTQSNATELDKELELDKDISTTSQKLKFTDEQMELAKLLLSMIADNNPNYVFRGNMNTWASEIRLMVERDKLSIELIKKVIIWCQQNSFWKTNILSTKKLREQFNQLTAKIQQEESQINLFSNKPKMSKKEQQLDELERVMMDFDRGNEYKASKNVCYELQQLR
jgi:predicted phage replisome organizer